MPLRCSAHSQYPEPPVGHLRVSGAGPPLLFRLLKFMALLLRLKGFVKNVTEWPSRGCCAAASALLARQRLFRIHIPDVLTNGQQGALTR